MSTKSKLYVSDISIYISICYVFGATKSQFLEEEFPGSTPGILHDQAQLLWDFGFRQNNKW